MEACLLSFIVGNILANNLPILFNVNELLVTALLIGCAIILRYYKIASALIGLCSVSAFMQWQILSPISINNQVQTLVIQAQVVQVSQHSLPGGKSQQKINAKVSCVYANEVCRPELWQPSSHIRLSYYQAQPKLQLDQLVKLKVKIKPATSFNNQAGFDYKKWLFSQSIFATGYIQQVEVISDQVSVRRGWHHQLQTLFSTFQFADLMLALTTGDRSWIDQNWSILKNTGTAHLLAISGLHIGLLFIWSYWLVCALLIPIRTRYYFACQTVGKLSALLIVWLFFFLCQHSIPIFRAAIFISIWVLLGLLRLNFSSYQRFVFALAIVLLILPLSPLSLSFWLSFTAVASVLLIWRLLQVWHLDKHNFVLRLLYLQAGISVLLIPMQLMFFQLIPTGSLLANIIAIPWVSFVILPLLMLAILCELLALGFANLLVAIAATNLSWLFEYLAWIERIFPAIEVGNYSLVVFLFLSFVVLLSYLSFRQNTTPVIRRLAAGSLVVLPLVVASIAQLYQLNNSWRVHMLDVGQGLAILVEDGTSAILYDTGDKFSSGFNLFEAVVHPVLVARGLRLDKVIISHQDRDHVGGIQAVKKLWPHTTIYQGEVGCQLVDKQSWLNLTWLSWQNTQANNRNNGSCVVCILDSQHKICLTGDIQADSESWLLQQRSFTELLPLDVLLVAHHGSRTSSSEAFIQATQADYALISRGPFNRFNHPHPNVVKRLVKQKSVILDTAVEGQTVVYFSDAAGIRVDSELSSLLLPWYKRRLN